MTQTENLVKRLPNDIGGLPAEPIQRVEHELEPWEKRCHALADVLDFHKIINTEEKRCGVEALGAEMIGKLSYYERWIVAFANILFRKGILTPTDFALQMAEVEARWNASPADSGTGRARTWNGCPLSAMRKGALQRRCGSRPHLGVCLTSRSTAAS